MRPIRHALSFEHQMGFTCYFYVDLGIALSFVLKKCLGGVWGEVQRAFQERNPNENKSRCRTPTAHSTRPKHGQPPRPRASPERATERPVQHKYGRVSYQGVLSDPVDRSLLQHGAHARADGPALRRVKAARALLFMAPDQQTISDRRLTVNDQRSTANYQQLTTNDQRSTIRDQRPTINS